MWVWENSLPVVWNLLPSCTCYGLRSTTHGLWLFGVKAYIPALQAVIANSNTTELQDVYVYSARNHCAHLFSDGPNDKWAVMIVLDDNLGEGGPVNETWRVFWIIWTNRVSSIQSNFFFVKVSFSILSNNLNKL